jgi:hypothetical protein
MRIAWLWLILIPLSAAAGDLPNPQLTPGAVDPQLTKAVLCSKTFHTSTIRHVSASTRKTVFAAYHVNPIPGRYELDHLISLELGGVNAAANLWPQSYVTKPWNAHVKDVLENKLHKLVCSGKIELEDAQTMIRTNWIAAWRTYVGAKR